MPKKIDVTWTCDRCGKVEIMTDPAYPDLFPDGWRYVVSASNSSVLLCADCLTGFQAWLVAALPAPVA
jgi:hypothetical protein